MKKKIILIAILVLLIMPFTVSYTSDYLFPITYSIGDLRYCLINGDCVIRNLNVTGNTTLSNITLVNYNVTGTLCLGGSCYTSLDRFLTNNTDVNLSTGTFGNVLINSVSGNSLDAYSLYGTANQYHSFKFDPGGYFLVGPDDITGNDYGYMDFVSAPSGYVVPSIASGGAVISKVGMVALMDADYDAYEFFSNIYMYPENGVSQLSDYLRIDSSLFGGERNLYIDKNYNFGTIGTGTFGRLQVNGNANITGNMQIGNGQNYTQIYNTFSSNPSYSNFGGTGNRKPFIVISQSTTKAILIDVAPTTIYDLLSGVKQYNVPSGYEHLYFASLPVAGKWIRFDFGAGSSKVINETKFYFNTAQSEGIWQWQASNDNLTWVNVSLPVNISSTITTFNLSNTLGYRYYQMIGVNGSGDSSGASWALEFEFKIDDYGSMTNIQTHTNGGEGGILNLQPNNGSIKLGALTVDKFGNALVGGTWIFNGLNVDNQTFYTDNINHRIGINTLAPAVTMQVNSPVSTTPALILGENQYASSGGILQLGDNTISQYARLEFQSSGNNFLKISTFYTGAGNYIALKAGNEEQLRVTKGGGVTVASNLTSPKITTTGFTINSNINSTTGNISAHDINSSGAMYVKENMLVLGNVNITGNATAKYFKGDGSLLTGLSSVPTGTIVMWASDTPPTGWKLCNAEYLLKASYPALYAVIGTTYGGDADGFNLPGLIGTTNQVFITAVGSGQSVGSSGGSSSTNTGTASLSDNIGYAAVSDAGHIHTLNQGMPGDNVVGNTAFQPDYTSTDTGYAAVSDSGHTHGNTDSGHTHDGVEPYNMRLNFIIKT